MSVELKEKQDVIIRVFSMQGQLVAFEHVSNFAGEALTKEIDLSEYPTGIYHIQVMTDKGVFNQKVRVQ